MTTIKLSPIIRSAIEIWIKGGDNHTECAKVFKHFGYELETYRPLQSIKLYRNEYPDEPSQYNRYTAWSKSREIASKYGGPHRVLVHKTFYPGELLVDITLLGDLDSLKQEEVIAKPQLGWY
jgi:hypothetical protein